MLEFHYNSNNLLMMILRKIMQTRTEYLRRTQAISTSLSEQGIELVKEAESNPEQLLINTKRRNIFTTAQKAIQLRIKSGEHFPGPGLTIAIATTLLKVAACQEMAQRFSFEYFKRFQEQEISLIFLAGQGLQGSSNNHVFVLVGDINVDDALLIAQGGQEAIISSTTPHIELNHFLHTQPENCIVADPFLQFCAYADESYDLFKPYCHERNITHVVAVKKYHATPELLACISTIEENAAELARQVNKELNLSLLNGITQLLLSNKAEKWIFSQERKCFAMTNTEENLRILMAIFAEHGFATGKGQEVGLARSTQTNILMLEVRHADTLDMKRLIAIGNTFAEAIKAKAQQTTTQPK